MSQYNSPKTLVESIFNELLLMRPMAEWLPEYGGWLSQHAAGVVPSSTSQPQCFWKHLTLVRLRRSESLVRNRTGSVGPTARGDLFYRLPWIRSETAQAAKAAIASVRDAVPQPGQPGQDVPVTGATASRISRGLAAPQGECRPQHIERSQSSAGTA